MKKRNLQVFWLVLLMITLIFQFPQIMKADDIVTAKIQGIKGDVFVKKGGGQREFTAFENMQVTQGDWVRTGPEGSAKIVYEDGNQTVIDANTKIMIKRLTSSEKGKETSVKLFAGGVWSKIKKMLNVGDQYEVETPTAVMGVRGTLYLVSVDDNGNVSVDVLEGAVAAGENTDPASGGTSFLVGTGSSLNMGASGQAGGQAPIDISTLVESVSPSVLVDIVNDIVERAKDIESQTKQALNQAQNQENALQALQMATQVNELTSLAQQVVQTVQQSANSQLNEQFQQTLQNNNQSMQTLIQSIEQQNQSAQNINQQAQQRAEEQGLTQDVIQQTVENIVNAVVGNYGTNPSAGTTTENNTDPTQNNTPNTNTTNTDSGSSGGSGGDDISSVSGNAYAVITSPLSGSNINNLSRITGTARDIDNGTITAVQIAIKKSGANEYLQSDGTWNTTEYWFNATTNDAYATWTYDLTAQQKSGVEGLGNVGITVSGRVNDGAFKTFSTLAIFTVDTVKPTSRAGATGCGTVQNGANAAVYDTGDKILITFSEPIKVSTLMANESDFSKISLSTGASWGSSPAIKALSPSTGFTDSFEITLGTNPTIASDSSHNLFVAENAAEDRAGNKNSVELSFDIPTIGPISGNATGTITTPANNSTVSGLTTIAGTATDPLGDTINSVHVAIKKASTASYLQNNGTWGETIYWHSAVSENNYAGWNISLSQSQQTGIIQSGENQLSISLKVDDGQPNIQNNVTTINLNVPTPAFKLQVNPIADQATSISGMTMPNWYVRIKDTSTGLDWGNTVQAGADGSYTVTGSAVQAGKMMAVFVGTTDTLNPELNNQRGEYFVSVGASGGGFTVDNASASSGTITGFAGLNQLVHLVNFQEEVILGQTTSDSTDGSFTINYASSQTAGTELLVLIIDYSEVSIGLCKIKLQ